MYYKYFLLSIILTSCNSHKSSINIQDNIIYINSIKKGTILKDTLNIKYSRNLSKKEYIPSSADIVLFEKLIRENNVINYDNFFCNKEKIENTFSKLKKYNRQYSGYINKVNDTIIIVNMLDFSNKKANKYFENWETINYNFFTNAFTEKQQLKQLVLELNINEDKVIKILYVSNYPKSNYNEKK